MAHPPAHRPVIPTTAQVPSRRFGSYTVLRRIGEGGMAVVYLAEAVDERGARLPVALKTTKRGRVGGVDLAELFATECDVMGLLHHPNLVEMYEVAKYGDALYLAMEYLPAGDLAKLLSALQRRSQRFPVPLALQIGIDVLRALARLHLATGASGTSLELVHGDVNPSNIFLALAPGRAKLGDLGVVSSGTMGSGLPDGMSAGKLHYLSPEQVAGKPLTPASDLFALGVVLFELLAGTRPFRGADAPEVLDRIANARFERPRGMPAALAAILEKALAKNPKNRFPSAGAFAAALVRYQLDHDLQPHENAFRDLVQAAHAPA